MCLAFRTRSKIVEHGSRLSGKSTYFGAGQEKLSIYCTLIFGILLLIFCAINNI